MLRPFASSCPVSSGPSPIVKHFPAYSMATQIRQMPFSYSRPVLRIDAWQAGFYRSLRAAFVAGWHRDANVDALDRRKDIRDHQQHNTPP